MAPRWALLHFGIVLTGLARQRGRRGERCLRDDWCGAEEDGELTAVSKRPMCRVPWRNGWKGAARADPRRQACYTIDVVCVEDIVRVDVVCVGVACRLAINKGCCVGRGDFGRSPSRGQR